MQFRAGETRLVRWVQEDLPILEDEEDVMVNAIEVSGDDPDEYIPLRKNFLTNYGSTRRNGEVY